MSATAMGYIAIFLLHISRLELEFKKLPLSGELLQRIWTKLILFNSFFYCNIRLIFKKYLPVITTWFDGGHQKILYFSFLHFYINLNFPSLKKKTITMTFITNLFHKINVIKDKKIFWFTANYYYKVFAKDRLTSLLVPYSCAKLTQKKMII